MLTISAYRTRRLAWGGLFHNPSSRRSPQHLSGPPSPRRRTRTCGSTCARRDAAPPVEAVARGQTGVAVHVGGTNIDPNETADLGAGIRVTNQEVPDGGPSMNLTVDVSDSAQLGALDLTLHQIGLHRRDVSERADRVGGVRLAGHQAHPTPAPPPPRNVMTTCFFRHIGAPAPRTSGDAVLGTKERIGRAHRRPRPGPIPR